MSVEGAPLLEAGSELPVLEFQPYLAAGDAGQSARMADGRAHQSGLDEPGRVLDVGKSGSGAHGSFLKGRPVAPDGFEPPTKGL